MVAALAVKIAGLRLYLARSAMHTDAVKISEQARSRAARLIAARENQLLAALAGAALVHALVLAQLLRNVWLSALQLDDLHAAMQQLVAPMRAERPNRSLELSSSNTKRGVGLELVGLPPEARRSPAELDRSAEARQFAQLRLLAAGAGGARGLRASPRREA